MEPIGNAGDSALDESGWEPGLAARTFPSELAARYAAEDSRLPGQQQPAEVSMPALATVWGAVVLLWLTLSVAPALCRWRVRQSRLPSSRWKSAHLPSPAAAAQRSAREVDQGSPWRGGPYSDGGSFKYGFPEDEAAGYRLRDRQLTRRLLADLQGSPEFSAHLRASGKSMDEVHLLNRQLNAYQSLRETDPDGFRRLWDDSTLWLAAAAARARQVPGLASALLVYASHHLLPPALAGCLAARLLVDVRWGLLPGTATARVLGAWLGVNYALLWRRRMCVVGALLGLRWCGVPGGTETSSLRCLLAHVVEVALVVGTGGAAAMVSLLLLCCRKQRQCLGELVVCVALQRAA
eukprot:jgi/Tetstr1/462984/TSEL_000100.t1